MSSYANSTGKLVYIEPQPKPPPSEQSSNRDVHHLHIKSEAERCQTFNKWPVDFRDKNNLAAAAFYFTNQSDIIYCTFYGLEIGCWQQGDLKTTNVGICLVDSLEVYLSETSVLVLPTGLWAAYPRPQRVSISFQVQTQFTSRTFKYNCLYFFIC